MEKNKSNNVELKSKLMYKPVKVKLLRKYYTAAKNKNRSNFALPVGNFSHVFIDTIYAKHVLEYLESKGKTDEDEFNITIN